MKTTHAKFLLSLAFTVAVFGCNGSIEAGRVAGQAQVPQGDDEVRVRTFDIDSIVGIDVDEDASGLGVALTIPEGAVVATQFKVVASVRPSTASNAMQLTLES